MLTELNVSNFAIIENLRISFGPGLNILSGETGAGKSVLLKSLALLMGGKSSAETIRKGAEFAAVEGAFDLRKRKDILAKLEELGIACDQKELIVRRVIHPEKSKIYLNGSLSTLNVLRDIVAPLIEVTGNAVPLIELTGQHENRNLLSRSYHLDILDFYAGHWERRASYEKIWQERKDIQEKLEKLQADISVKNQRLDFLIYQRDEIARLNLSPGEDIELESQVKKLKNSSRLIDFIDLSENLLVTDEESTTQRIATVLKKSSELNSYDPELFQKVQQLQSARTIIEDVIYDLRKYANDLNLDPETMEEKEARLSDLRKLQKKFGSSIDDILRSLIEIESEIADLQNVDSRIEELKKQDAQLGLKLKTIANELHQKRASSAKGLVNLVNLELKDLNMKGVQFKISIESMDELTATGATAVEFMTANSEKDEPKALSKAASGGELSRILLSLKKVVGAGNQPRTYLFDEVDTGVSGPTAEKVGRKLRSIANGQQVICVTHLPQVAACGDIHFFIQKSPSKNSVSMQVDELKGSNKTQEIARLISGEKITKTSLAHAEQLLSELGH